MTNKPLSKVARESQRPCPLCTQNQVQPLLQLHYALYDDQDIDAAVTVVGCDRCGMLFNDSSTTAKQLKAYYHGNDYYSETTTGGAGGYSASEEGRYHHLFQRLCHFKAVEEIRLLDVGCGNGGLLAYLQHCGIKQLNGIEASLSCRRTAEQHTSVTVFPAIPTKRDLPSPPNVIVLSHLLEHLFDPLSTLTDIVALVENEALFYIEVPNGEAVWVGETSWKELYIEHINHFDTHHLSQLLEQSGLAIIECGLMPFRLGAGQDDECIYALCRLSKEPLKSRKIDPNYQFMEAIIQPPPPPISPEQLTRLLRYPNIAIWGISQYVQLILGLYPELLRTRLHLVDRASAKVGRSIGGITIHSLDKLKQLGKDDLILLPKGPYIDEMKEYIRQNSIKCDIELI